MRFNIEPQVGWERYNAWSRSWVVEGSVAAIHAASGSVNATDNDPLVGLDIGFDLDGQKEHSEVCEDGQVVVLAGGMAYLANDGLVRACADTCCSSHGSDIDFETRKKALEGSCWTLGDMVVFESSVFAKFEQPVLGLIMGKVLEPFVFTQFCMGLEKGLVSQTLTSDGTDVDVIKGIDERTDMFVQDMVELQIVDRIKGKNMLNPSLKCVGSSLWRMDATTCSPPLHVLDFFFFSSCTMCSRSREGELRCF